MAETTRYYIDANEFFLKYKKYLPKDTLAFDIYKKTKDNKMNDFEFDLADLIIENVKISDITDCIRLLLQQKNEVINNIVDKMFDKNGEETDYIKSGINYNELLKIIVKNGGKEETFGEKRQSSLQRQIKDYEQKVKQAHENLDAVLKEHEKIKELCITQEAEAIKKTIYQIDFLAKEVLKMRKETKEQLLKLIIEDDRKYIEKYGLFSEKE